MRLRPLSVFMLLSVLLLPNRLAGCLLADAPGSDSTESRKSVEVRGRNRINPPVCLEACPGLVRIAGRPEPPRPSLIRSLVPPEFDLVSRPSPSSPKPILLRLRC